MKKLFLFILVLLIYGCEKEEDTLTEEKEVYKIESIEFILEKEDGIAIGTIINTPSLKMRNETSTSMDYTVSLQTEKIYETSCFIADEKYDYEIENDIMNLIFVPENIIKEKILVSEIKKFKFEESIE